MLVPIPALTAPPVSPPKLFRAWKVAATLWPEVELRDVRRDHRAVGSTVIYGTAEVSLQSVCVFGDRAQVGAIPGEWTNRGEFEIEPMSILGSDRFVVRFEQFPSHRISYRRARMRGERVELGGSAGEPGRAITQRKPLRTETIVFPERLWPRPGGRRVAFSDRAEVEWSSGPGGVKVGSALVTAIPHEWDVAEYHHSQALIQDATGESLLADRTIGAGKDAFGKIVWRSAEGWFVCQTSTGLAWIEPLNGKSR